MNLRILKKLSKRAAPLLFLLGDDRKQFRNEDGDGYIAMFGFEHKHWKRIRTNSRETIWNPQYERVIRPRHGKGYVNLREPDDAWPFTPIVGNWSEGVEDDWHEETAWEALRLKVREHFTDYDVKDGEYPKLLRKFNNPATIFAAAEQLASVQPLRSSATEPAQVSKAIELETA